jgi:hypothetical protein
MSARMSQRVMIAPPDCVDDLLLEQPSTLADSQATLVGLDVSLSDA